MKTSRFFFSNTHLLPLICGLCCVLFGLASCGPVSSTSSQTKQAIHPAVTINAQPSRLRISHLGIDAPIIPVGVDRYGAMEAPGAGHPASDPLWGTAFWWRQGTQPGQTGNAVLAGHVDRNDGSPAVFWNLDQIQTGNLITITNQSGQTLTFRVTSVESFDNPDGGPNDPVIQRVFGPASSANLNLITCYGTWVGTEYNQRLVVFSTLVTGT